MSTIIHRNAINSCWRSGTAYEGASMKQFENAEVSITVPVTVIKSHMRVHSRAIRSNMNTKTMLSLLLLVVILLAACTENLDPLSPGSTDGKYALGIKALVPLAVGNRWTYNVVLYDTSGAERMRYSYNLSVVTIDTADTNRIPLVPPNTNRSSLTLRARLWYLLQGELGATTWWQVDSVENLRVRKSDDTLFYEQTAFNFRASLGDTTAPKYIGGDTLVWASGDTIVTAADSVKSKLVSKGIDTLRTTLGSAPYFQYRRSYVVRTDYTNYYFKPGFGLFLIEHFRPTPGGTMVRVRRDELTSYYLR